LFKNKFTDLFVSKILQRKIRKTPRFDQRTNKECRFNK